MALATNKTDTRIVPDECSEPREAVDGLRHRGPKVDVAIAPEQEESPAVLATPQPASIGLSARIKTLKALIVLWAASPLLLTLACLTWMRHKLLGAAFEYGNPEKKMNILVTGGKMTKCSAVARAVGRDGHNVFTAEILPYRFCHSRFSRYVSKHYVLPRPTVQPKEWEETIMSIVKEQSIDLIIPCTAPVESSAYAHLQERLPEHVRVFAFDGQTNDELDNKYTFNQALVRAGLKCPLTANMECLEDAVQFFKDRDALPDDGKRFIVKPAVYDPKARTEILFLPIPDKKRQMEYLQSRNASKEVPYVIQEVLVEPELGCYGLFCNGELTGFELFESAASCLAYRQVTDQRYQQVMELCKGLGKAGNLTGQLTLDLMHTADGDMVPIECNPRIHSAVCTLEGHKNLGAAFTDPDFAPDVDAEVVTSKKTTFRYWIMDQVFLMTGFWKPKSCFKLSLAEMLTGTDAMLAPEDPVPFLAMYLLQIPSLLLLELVRGTEWLKIDFCIGKIVKEGGD